MLDVVKLCDCKVNLFSPFFFICFGLFKCVHVLNKGIIICFVFSFNLFLIYMCACIFIHLTEVFAGL